MIPLNPFQYRRTLGQFATGVTVISFQHGSETVGMTVNSFTSVSLEPPLLLFCPAHGTRFAESIESSKPFTVSILDRDQLDACFHFAGLASSHEPRWEDVGDGLPPALAGSLTWLSCRVHAWHPHGDHLVVLGGVERLGEVSEAEPLVFFRGGYPHLSGPLPPRG